MSTMLGIRIEQVPVGYQVAPGAPLVTDDISVHNPDRNCVFVTAKNYEAIKASARDMGQVTYSRR